MAATPLGALSSATAQGFLPRYEGYATASLVPNITLSSSPPKRFGENQPLHRPGSSGRQSASLSADEIAAEQRRKEKGKGKAILTDSPELPYNPYTTGIGPINGSDW